jgi:uncharacterized protein (DUF302 family)
MSTSETTALAPRAGYGFGAELELPYDQAVERVRAALKVEGFGVLTTIDVQATLKEKLGVEFERYVILGACNPPLAHRALTAEHEIGLLLPCNVIVHEHGPNTVVSIIDPLQMLGFVGDNPALQAVANEVNEKLLRVAESLLAPAAA